MKRNQVPHSNKKSPAKLRMKGWIKSKQLKEVTLLLHDLTEVVQQQHHSMRGRPS